MIIPAGADISEPWFDICILPPAKEPIFARFQRTKAGLRQCVKWLEENSIAEIELVIEPTGRYGELVAEYFHGRKHRVLLAQPLKFRRYAQSYELRIKDDRRDARLLAEYCRERAGTLREWRPRTQLEWELKDTQIWIRSLTKRTVILQCQLQCGLRSEFVQSQLKSELESVNKTLASAVDRAEELIAQHPTLQADFALLLTIPGVGNKTAVLLLTLIDFRSFRTGRALACFLGLTKRKHESGTSVKDRDRISKRGSTYVRASLFMPARVARQHNPALRNFSQRMLAEGKHDFAIQMAVIRKLVTTAWAVITSGKAWQADYVNPHYKPI